MQTFTSLSELHEAGGSQFGLALGVFDGVHLGHQAVIDAARGEGLLGVVTFEPHPVQVLAPDRAPRRILSSLEHKKRILGGYGVDFVVVLEFSAEFAAAAARSFADEILESGCSVIAAGDSWRFGRGREGTMELLAELGDTRGVKVRPVAPLKIGGERVSSTRIRRLLRADDLAGAAKLLGRSYSVFGKVVKGQQLGRTIGFPTANVEVSEELLPSSGVYTVVGNGIRGVANVGTRPTVDQSQRRSLEVHLFTDDLPNSYAWELEVAFGEKLREVMKFQSLDDLKEQIAEDVRQAKRVGLS